ncbi:LysR family transcriptional regulator [Streptomyces shenzhenensis]|uniref:LysR family transcriptional regulator n=1 Tax=Streptomyces shenzhenensis TaxID=943815 RepID=A0A3M0I0V7_9ACTN|nr:LysR family transcriptional regulator [Streptomyces shenzhenensis]RMB82424.1 LysR family transcriptional regulator [Streptomyces shenzhenensis]
MTGVTLVGLRVVREVAATGSFSEAAASLGYTQSAVSRQVKAVESALGANLFERGARGVTPTEAGLAFVRHAADILSSLDTALREVNALRQHITGCVAVGAISAAAPSLVSRAFAQLADEHPHVTVSFVEDSTPGLLRQLRSNRLDVAVVGVCAGPQEHDLDGLRQETLLEDDLRVALPSRHPLATRSLVRADELRHESWIVESAVGDSPYYGAWPTLVQPTITHQARDWSTRLGMVAAGLGICLLPGMTVPSAPAGVTIARVEDRHWQGHATIAVTNEQRSPEADAAVAALRQQASDLR